LVLNFIVPGEQYLRRRKGKGKRLKVKGLAVEDVWQRLVI
jgi:cytochrome c-type biogenesis protein CcmE